MIDNHMDCIIIKVASYKLFEKHLNKTIKELQPYFMQLKEECGMNVCGEGGEYESLTLDCPLYKKKLRIDDYEVVYHDKN
jgi:diphthine-ammonia ligase